MQGLDIETTALRPEDGRVRLVQIRDGAKGRVYDGHDPAVPDALRGLTDGLAHNAPFERQWVKRHYGIDLDLDDTMVMSQVLYTGTNAARAKQFSHSLQAVVKRELKRELDKTEQGSDWTGELAEEQIRYAALDAQVLPDLADTLLRKIDRAGLRKVYELERRISHAVDQMERNGFRIDLVRLDAFIAENTEQAERLKAELEEEWGINPGSSKQLREHFHLDEREGWPTTPAGAPSTNQEAMKLLLEEEPSVAKWVEWKRVEKLRSTYGTSLQEQIVDGRIHARFNPFGGGTGRFSSSTPNLQNIPKCGELGPRLRGLFWAGAKDRVLIKADYASIELWVAAILWDEPHMQHALQQGVNMHVATAAALFNVKPGEVTKEQNSRTHHERFPGLDRALKALLRYAEYPVLERGGPSSWI
jgi:DNA polymerase I-like protein with 3'-5' exonuclease and polymerase domains